MLERRNDVAMLFSKQVAVPKEEGDVFLFRIFRARPAYRM